MISKLAEEIYDSMFGYVNQTDEEEKDESQSVFKINTRGIGI